jgi:Protein of unknown function (DUF1549)/Protein of unknown function (DUF1553)
MGAVYVRNHALRCSMSRAATCATAAALSIGVCLASGSSAWSFDPQQKDQTQTPAKSIQEKKAARKARALQAAAKSKAQVAPDPGPSEAGKSALATRPAKSITAPTLTSEELDRLIKQFLTKNSPTVEPASLTNDVEFVRRVYFDLIGKPPTPEQFVLFVRGRGKDKRARLIDDLLANPEFARNWARYWRDVIKFHSTNENLARVRFDLFEEWLAKQIQSNKPWDEIVSDMIRASGRNDEHGAVGFSLAYDGQPVEMAGEASRIFMGIQIQCAQCHDHKTDSWKRQQFHELAAFFAGLRPRPVVQGGQGQLPVVALVFQGPRHYTMPDKDNPAKQIPVTPRFFLSSSKSHPEPALSESLTPSDRRAIVASYITGQDNPWFAKAFINRVWYALLGEAFFEPIDDIGPERSAKAGEVLDPLAEQWQKGGYDIRWLFRTILNTQAYQRRVRSTANAAGRTTFASSCPSRLRSDQIFNALAQALALPLDANGNLITPVNPTGRGPGQGKNAPLAKKAQQLERSLGLTNSTKRAGSQVPAKGAALKAAQAAGLANQVPAAKKQALVQRLGGPRLLFDRLFGIDPSIPNEDVTGSIPQALFLMNGPLVNNRIQARPGTVLGEILMSAPDERTALNALYVRVLSRPPTAREVEICGRYMANVGDQREAFEDIFWSLINTTEFLTRR